MNLFHNSSSIIIAIWNYTNNIVWLEQYAVLQLLQTAQVVKAWPMLYVYKYIIMPQRELLASIDK